MMRSQDAMEFYLQHALRKALILASTEHLPEVKVKHVLEDFEGMEENTVMMTSSGPMLIRGYDPEEKVFTFKLASR